MLDGLEAIRRRPGMYIATTAAAGLHHLVWEVVDNSIDESMAGVCKNIEVTLNKDGSVTVQDDGRGIPEDIVPKTGLSGVESCYMFLHTGGKFGDEGSAYKVSGGLHGVGVKAVNALSTKVDVTVHRDGGIFHVEFINGGHLLEVPGKKDKDGKPLLKHLEKIGTSTDHGTTVTFWPDPTIFTETTVFNYETVKNHLRQMAFLNTGLKITLTDDRGKPRSLILLV
jgi:DNA gyrase subunit B